MRYTYSLRIILKLLFTYQLMNYSTIPEAIEEIKKGNFLLIVDEPDRENQGDLFLPAIHIDNKKLNFFEDVGRGIITVPISTEIAERLEITPMVKPSDNSEQTRVCFAVSVDSTSVKNFGAPNSDRITTLKALCSEETKSSDFVRPGHIFPLISRKGKLADRHGHTEATVTLCELAGLPQVAVITEQLTQEGEIAHEQELFQIAEKYNIKIITVVDLIAYVNSLKK